MKKRNPTMIILMLIMLVNALSYGTIIPLLYPYASRFGVDPMGLSFLFASFSLAQLIATPIIGRLSDKYGRKPMLLLSLAGTGVSLAMFASAQGAVMLFVSRILDGITGGNISVAQAVIADSTAGKDRAQGFAMLGAAFGVGFLLGPAIGGLLSQVSLSAPFWFAAILALVGTMFGIFMLKETLPKGERQPSKQSFFNLQNLLGALTSPTTGVVLIITLVFTTALNGWFIGFQTFTTDVLRLSARDIGLIFASYGLISILMQVWGIRLLMQKIPNKNTILIGSLFLCMVTMIPLYFFHSLWPFVTLALLFGVTFAPIMPVTTAILSERTRAEDQGGIMGINQSFTSLGQVIGPLIAGVVAVISVNTIFATVAAIIGLSLLATRWLQVPAKKKVDL